jgi:hypothetical protein
MMLQPLVEQACAGCDRAIERLASEYKEDGPLADQVHASTNANVQLARAIATDDLDTIELLAMSGHDLSILTLYETMLNRASPQLLIKWHARLWPYCTALAAPGNPKPARRARAVKLLSRVWRLRFYLDIDDPIDLIRCAAVDGDHDAAIEAALRSLRSPDLEGDAVIVLLHAWTAHRLPRALLKLARAGFNMAIGHGLDYFEASQLSRDENLRRTGRGASILERTLDTAAAEGAPADALAEIYYLVGRHFELPNFIERARAGGFADATHSAGEYAPHSALALAADARALLATGDPVEGLSKAVQCAMLETSTSTLGPLAWAEFLVSIGDADTACEIYETVGVHTMAMEDMIKLSPECDACVVVTHTRARNSALYASAVLELARATSRGTRGMARSAPDAAFWSSTYIDLPRSEGRGEAALILARVRIELHHPARAVMSALAHVDESSAEYLNIAATAHERLAGGNAHTAIELRKKESELRMRLFLARSQVVRLTRGTSAKLAAGEFVEQQCVVCLDAPAQVTMLPCNHRCACPGCASRASDKCPMCRTKVRSTRTWA